MTKDKLYKQIVEAALLSADKPMSLRQLRDLLEANHFMLSLSDMEALMKALAKQYRHRGMVLNEVASGYRFQVNPDVAAYLAPMWAEKPPRYSRASLETLALIAYKQPITRGEIEEVRGVSVSSHIIRALLDRGWVDVVGHKEVPGRPALYATSKRFLDYFNLKSLQGLPELQALNHFEGLNILEGQQLPLESSPNEIHSTPEAEPQQGVNQARDEN